MSNNYLVLGQWNVCCDVCGKRYKIGEMKKRWDGLLVCERDWEQDHPQKYIRVRADGQAVPIVRHEPEDTFKFSCDFIGIQPLAEWAVAGCAKVGEVSLLVSDLTLAGVMNLVAPPAIPNFGFADGIVAGAVGNDYI